MARVRLRIICYGVKDRRSAGEAWDDMDEVQRLWGLLIRFSQFRLCWYRYRGVRAKYQSRVDRSNRQNKAGMR